MEKTQKKVFGLFGLMLVVAMTIFAAFLPGPSASAATNSSMTDTVTVTVIDEIPTVEILNPASGEDISSLDDSIEVKYANMDNFTVTITYVDEDGTEHTETIADVHPSDEHGDLSIPFRAMGEEYGYGKYIIKITGQGSDGLDVEDTVEFDYVAATASATEDEETGNVVVDLDYPTDDSGLDDDEKVAKFEINVYDENGNLVDDLSPIVVDAPLKNVEIPFDEYGLPSGTYTIVIQPKNANGDDLHKRIVLTIQYTAKGIVVPSTADTGGLFKNLNISQTDYLITGLGLFALVGIGGVVFIARRNKR